MEWYEQQSDPIQSYSTTVAQETMQRKNEAPWKFSYFQSKKLLIITSFAKNKSKSRISPTTFNVTSCIAFDPVKEEERVKPVIPGDGREPMDPSLGLPRPLVLRNRDRSCSKGFPAR
ncbi:hypothetical protein TNCV_1012741 [Trichonephila clavipes]|uniref:Uncharacterized protein n=1 Tax=Trichonephila clavipes TaxID=2585209 RepID=A0A8X6VXC6_TRICX|nr:hypothetical protein TNCV_1012741 [Trichonephila clavipes]